MSISLQKGANISLSKEAPGLVKTRVGLGWDPRATSGDAFDLDAAAVLVGKDGKARGLQDFIFYNNLSSPDGSVVHQGDNLTGEGDGDDEQIVVDLSAVEDVVDRIVFTVSIYEADTRKQTFGQVRDAYIRLVDDATGTEIVKYDLSEDASTDTAVNFAEIYRGPDGSWKFKAIGQGYNTGLSGVVSDFGLDAS
jgi:tellurium resistance protein TerD